MLRRLSFLPWPEIAWSVVLVDLGLMVVCPLLALLFGLLPLPDALAAPLFLIGCGILAGNAARLIFARLAANIYPDNGIGWALVLGVTLTAYPFGAALGAALQALPTVLSLPPEAASLTQTLGQLLGITQALFSLLFALGGAMGMFWRATRIGR